MILGTVSEARSRFEFSSRQKAGSQRTRAASADEDACCGGPGSQSHERESHRANAMEG